MSEDAGPFESRVWLDSLFGTRSGFTAVPEGLRVPWLNLAVYFGCILMDSGASATEPKHSSGFKLMKLMREELAETRARNNLSSDVFMEPSRVDVQRPHIAHTSPTSDIVSTFLPSKRGWRAGRTILRKIGFDSRINLVLQ
jgi:hypothetical protein